MTRSIPVIHLRAELEGKTETFKLTECEWEEFGSTDLITGLSDSIEGTVEFVFEYQGRKYRGFGKLVYQRGRGILYPHEKL